MSDTQNVMSWVKKGLPSHSKVGMCLMMSISQFAGNAKIEYTYMKRL